MNARQEYDMLESVFYFCVKKKKSLGVGPWDQIKIFFGYEHASPLQKNFALLHPPTTTTALWKYSFKAQLTSTVLQLNLLVFDL